MRISTIVAICFLLAFTAISGASVAVASVEPGTERIVAALVAAVAFALVVFGMISPGDWVSPARKFLSWMSETRTRTFASASAMLAIALGVLILGPVRLYHVTIACADAKSIILPKPFGEQVESCSADSRVSFTSWHPLGREHLQNSLLCNYSTGSQTPLVQGNTLHCPVHTFIYYNDWDKDKKTWVRNIDGTWAEQGTHTVCRAEGDCDVRFGTSLSLFREIGVASITDSVGSPADGTIVRRMHDGGNMELLIPDMFAGQRTIYIRDTPQRPWRNIGSVVSP